VTIANEVSVGFYANGSASGEPVPELLPSVWALNDAALRTLMATIARVTHLQYSLAMKTAVIPQIRVEPELRAELESVLKQGETLTDFVEVSVRNAIAFRRVQTAFHARAQAASEQYHRTGVATPVESVLGRLQSKLDAKRKKLGR
jgi:hypothetical protein